MFLTQPMNMFRFGIRLDYTDRMGTKFRFAIPYILFRVSMFPPRMPNMMFHTYHTQI